MTVLVVKSSSDDWYQIRNIDSIESLMNLSKKCKRYVIERNWHYQEDPNQMIEFWDGMTLEDAKIISTLPYKVEIYDTYRE